MLIRSITVSSSRKLPNPNVDYASVSGLISITADLSAEDNAAACAKKLQAQCDSLVEHHMESQGERMRQRSAALHELARTQRIAAATNSTAADLAAKHRGAAA